jgi:acetolactate synthase-1/2/3 large subunit
MNFPGGHDHHLGYRRNSFVDEADFILMLDVDVPWIKAKVQPKEETRVFHIDIDPLKTGIGYWHYPAERVYQADSLQTLAELAAMTPKDPSGVNLVSTGSYPPVNARKSLRRFATKATSRLKN